MTARDWAWQLPVWLLAGNIILFIANDFYIQWGYWPW
jgi:hypothetical protein